MESFSLTRIAEFASAVGSVATPFVVATVASLFQRRQKVAEAAMAERIKRIGLISPLLNMIYSYRERVGSYLDMSPEEVLRAKREADREFWTFEYLWTPEFKAAYHAFMEESFEMNRGAGNKAGIHAESKHYPIESKTPNWVAFTEETVDKPRNALRMSNFRRSRRGIWDSGNEIDPWKPEFGSIWACDARRLEPQIIEPDHV